MEKQQTSATATIPAQTVQGWTLVEGKDLIGQEFPFTAQGDTRNLTWGSGIGETQGRLLRLHDLASGFYDFRIDNDGDFSITKKGEGTINLPSPALIIAKTGEIRVVDSLTVGTTGGPTLTSQAGGLTLSSSLAIHGSLSVAGAAALTSLSVSGGASFGQLPIAPPGAKAVMIDSNGNLCQAA
jgi:hypothetical protein